MAKYGYNKRRSIQSWKRLCEESEQHKEYLKQVLKNNDWEEEFINSKYKTIGNFLRYQKGM